MKRLSIFEITLVGVILSLSITAKYFDRFIPHVHPIHVVVILIGISIMRLRVSILLIISYIILKMILFGPGGITGFMITVHTLATVSLLLMSSISFFLKKMNSKYKIAIFIPIIIFTMIIYLAFTVIGDTDYSPKELPFTKKI